MATAGELANINNMLSAVANAAALTQGHVRIGE